MPEDELSTHHTSSYVADTIGELMNQCMGQFQISLKKKLGIGVNQNQPKMVALNQAMRISLETEIDHPQFMRVEFRTMENKLFYLETTIEKVDFIMEESPGVVKNKDINVDELIENQKKEDNGPVSRSQNKSMKSS